MGSAVIMCTSSTDVVVLEIFVLVCQLAIFHLTRFTLKI